MSTIQRVFKAVMISILLLSGSMVSAADRVWNGPATGDWFTAGNWLPTDNYPQAGESVAVTGGSVLVSADTALLGSLSVSNATVVCSNWTTRLRATTVTLWTNGVITLPAAFTNNAMSNRIHIVCTDLGVQAGGRIDANYKGYARRVLAGAGVGIGPGAGGQNSSYGAGGGHGGFGGNQTEIYTSNLGGITNGLAPSPETPGSSGATGANSHFGGAGGGAIRIDASGGAVTVNGIVSADGEITVVNGHGGGGSGGSIWITCATFGGAGTISANGGNNGSATHGGGGGGGGRIALDYSALSGTPTVSISANAGRSFFGILTSREGNVNEAPPEPGTIWMKDASLITTPISRLSGRLIVNGASSWTTSSLTVSNVTVGFFGTVPVNVTGNLTVTGTNGMLLNEAGGDVACVGMRLENGGKLALRGNLTCSSDLVADHSNSYVVVKGNTSLHCGGNLILTNRASGYFFSGATNATWTSYGLLVSVTGDVRIATNSWIFPVSHTTNGGSCLFRMSNLTVAANSGFNANSNGYGGVYNANGYGPGRGLASGGGAGYGGKGGETFWAAGRVGITYGSTNAPIAPGSGGGMHPNAPLFSYGGGLVRIEAAGAVTLDGLLTANGQNGYYNATEMRSGCASGGGIFIMCDSFSGATSAMLRANGGTGEGFATRYGGGGGGGRISVAVGLSASDRANLLAGQVIAGLTVSGDYPGYAGQVSVTNGIGWTNLPPGGAEVGTYRFLTVAGANTRTLIVQGSPSTYGSPSPRGYGTHGSIPENQWITNSVASPANVADGQQWISTGWALTNDIGAVANGATTQAVFQLATNLYLTWNWTNQYQLSVSSADAGQGSVNADVVNGWYNNGSVVSGITATPSNGYVFSLWSGSGVPAGSELQNPLTVTQSQARILTANFTMIGGQDRTWSGTGDWASAGNWTPGGIPGPEDRLVIGSGRCVIPDSRTVASLTVGPSATLVFTNWTSVLSAGTVTVQSNGVITLPAAFTGSQASNRIQIVCTDLTVEGGGLIQADYKGFASANNANGYGPGKGLSSGGGAGHGGRGGSSVSGAGGGTYGEVAEPALPGSGGAGQANVGFGGAGGGAIRINASGTLTVDGVISADGENGLPYSSSLYSGCGSGGSVYITCATFGGSGRVSADGGTGAGFAARSGGGGGGGRVAIHYAALSGSPTVRVSAAGGLGRYVFDLVRDEVLPQAVEAEPGTIWLSDAGLLSSTISRISGFVVPGSAVGWTISSLTVTNGMVFGLAGTNALNVDGDITVTGTGSALMSQTGGRVAAGGQVHLTGGGRLGLKGDLECDGDLLADHSNSWVTLKGNVTAAIGGDMVLTNGADSSIFSGTTNATWPQYGLLVAVTGNVSLASGSWIYPYSHSTNGGSCRFVVNSLSLPENSGFDADGKGYGGVYNGNGYGPGRGLASGGGAGYGGKGGKSSYGSNLEGAAYGVTNTPVHAGSGGGTQSNVPEPCFGGGLVWIEADGLVLLNGRVLANGVPGGVFGGSSMRGGCGSGGGIRIQCAQFSGNGSLEANGGSGADTAASSFNGGGGGGGRIAVWYGAKVTEETTEKNLQISSTPPASFSGTPEVDAGIGYDDGIPANLAQDGSIVFVRVRPAGGTMIMFR